MPGWVMTFADLMSLLMCFFVLLLSFSEMDVNYYKQVAGSMKDAFGVQRQISSKETPRGVSVIAREFSPGRPDPTPLKVVQQHTTNQMKHYLDLDKGQTSQDKKSVITPIKSASMQGVSRQSEQKKSGKSDGRKESIADKIRAALEKETKAGAVDFEKESDRIIIRLNEKVSFRPGSAFLKRQAIPILEKLGNVLREATGRIIVAGHTDDIQIDTAQFRSNWELSSSRAATVVGELNWTSHIVPERLMIEGHGYTRPLVPNINAENRQKNRRVEITLLQNPDDAAVDENEMVDDSALSEVSEKKAELVGDQRRGLKKGRSDSVVEKTTSFEKGDRKARAEAELAAESEAKAKAEAAAKAKAEAELQAKEAARLEAQRLADEAAIRAGRKPAPIAPQPDKTDAEGPAPATPERPTPSGVSLDPTGGLEESAIEGSFDGAIIELPSLGIERPLVLPPSE
ncbi:hypothetical protein BOW53_00855 [Solemya pervernicosa gill symbiont]|uniref:OmpA-like domain-containing protein n=2 Tax=Gammaproteobacteria incertae sedis TaxID=118884 RepID=A0A1T2LAR6_9GAMM|nr:hypothetical protein BOW53_00855 [Solemya pervernicosa gill symbiont]